MCHWVACLIRMLYLPMIGVVVAIENKAIRPAHVGQRNGRCLRRWPPPQKWQRMMKSGSRSTKCLVIAIQVGRIYFVVILVVSRDPNDMLHMCWFVRMNWHSKLQFQCIWWRRQMETFSALLALWPLVDSPHKGQWRGILMCFFYLRLNKQLSKHATRRCLETHYDVTVMVREISEINPWKRHIQGKLLCFFNWRYMDPCRSSFKDRVSIYIPQILWAVITCPCPWHLLLAHACLYVERVVIIPQGLTTNYRISRFK